MANQAALSDLDLDDLQPHASITNKAPNTAKRRPYTN